MEEQSTYELIADLMDTVRVVSDLESLRSVALEHLAVLAKTFDLLDRTTDQNRRYQELCREQLDLLELVSDRLK